MKIPNIECKHCAITSINVNTTRRDTIGPFVLVELFV